MLQAVKAKGIVNAVKRSWSIVKSYGITSKKMEENLHLFKLILDKYSCGATFPITATILERHKDTIKKYSNSADVEFAIHGLMHKDYTPMPWEERVRHLKIAMEIFRSAGFLPLGFRAPYLRSDEDMAEVLNAVGPEYESDECVLWTNAKREISKELDRIRRFYEPTIAELCGSLPIYKKGLIKIPVSLPDDEILVDRLKREEIKIEEIWVGILKKYTNEE